MALALHLSSRVAEQWIASLQPTNAAGVFSAALQLLLIISMLWARSLPLQHTVTHIPQLGVQ
jgi:hypothetical protein